MKEEMVSLRSCLRSISGGLKCSTLIRIFRHLVFTCVGVAAQLSALQRRCKDLDCVIDGHPRCIEARFPLHCHRFSSRCQ